MNITYCLQELQTLEQTGDVMISRIGREFQAIYGPNKHILKNQIHRYLEILNTYKTFYGDEEIILARAPGRVDLMGSHTDYHQGYVLPMALDKDTVIVAGKRDDKKVVISNTAPNFPIREFVLQENIPHSAQGHWENYVKAAAQALARSYGPEHIKGINAVVDGYSPFKVPLAAGLSSSSALLIAAALALTTLNEITMEPKQFARFCGEAEWYVGTRGGFMDHFTSILSRKGHALFLDCRPVEVSGEETFFTEDIPLLEGYEVAICNTNVKKEKAASSEYNTRVLETKIGLELLKPHFPEAQYLRDIPANTPLQEFLPQNASLKELQQLLTRQQYAELFQNTRLSPDDTLKILPRCQHVLTENARVLKGCELLKSGEMRAFGALMIESYISIRDQFEASCPELNLIISSALRFPGTLGARIAGAGWGGCAVAMVEASASSEFQVRIAKEYYEHTGIHAQIFLCQPGQGAGFFVG